MTPHATVRKALADRLDDYAKTCDLRRGSWLAHGADCRDAATALRALSLPPPATQIGGGVTDEAMAHRNSMVLIRNAVVMAIAFLGRDEGSDRMTTTVPQIIQTLANADVEVRRLLAAPQRSVAREVIAQIIRDKLGNWSFDINEALPELAIKDAADAILALSPTELHEGGKGKLTCNHDGVNSETLPDFAPSRPR